MNIIFTNKSGNDLYKLIKRECGWELMRWDEGGDTITRGQYAGREKKAAWRKMGGGNGCYPNSMKHAVNIIADDQLYLQSGTVNIKEARSQVNGFLNDLEAHAERFSEGAVAS
jgi:hypothetical protein